MLPILTSPELWISVVSILALVIARFVPGFTLEVPTLVGYILVVVALLFKVFSDPDLSPIGRWVRLLKTPEFVVAILSIVVLFMQGFGIILDLGITIEQVAGAIVVLVGYIFGSSYKSRRLALAKMSHPPVPLKAVAKKE